MKKLLDVLRSMRILLFAVAVSFLVTSCASFGGKLNSADWSKQDMTKTGKWGEMNNGNSLW